MCCWRGISLERDDLFFGRSGHWRGKKNKKKNLNAKTRVLHKSHANWRRSRSSVSLWCALSSLTLAPLLLSWAKLSLPPPIETDCPPSPHSCVAWMLEITTGLRIRSLGCVTVANVGPAPPSTRSKKAKKRESCRLQRPQWCPVNREGKNTATRSQCIRYQPFYWLFLHFFKKLASSMFHCAKGSQLRPKLEHQNSLIQHQKGCNTANAYKGARAGLIKRFGVILT